MGHRLVTLAMHSVTHVVTVSHSCGASRDSSGLPETVVLVAACASVVAVLLSAWWYRKTIRDERFAALCAVVEELRTNLNVTQNTLVKLDGETEIQRLLEEVLRMHAAKGGARPEHPPNPSDSPSTAERLLPMYRGRLGRLPDLVEGQSHYVMELHTSATEYALVTGRPAPMFSRTVFVGLSHLYYSMRRHNWTVRRYNGESPELQQKRCYQANPPLYRDLGLSQSTSGLQSVQAAYVYWVHFRLRSTLIDMALDASVGWALRESGVLRSLKQNGGALWPHYSKWTLFWLSRLPLCLKLRSLRRHARRAVAKLDAPSRPPH